MDQVPTRVTRPDTLSPELTGLETQLARLEAIVNALNTGVELCREELAEIRVGLGLTPSTR